MENTVFQTFSTRILLLLVAGGTGAISRYFLSAWLNQAAWCGKPWGILVCNLLGCFLFGMLSVILTRNFSPEVKLIILTGFLGAFTTFSTFAFDIVDLLNESRYVTAFASLFGHNFFGILLTACGLCVGKWIS
ncbi:MAG: fluoride efflux transporter CrcB [Planctomycetia bacterium]|nr:fluoride efflux transporter CrcB [Planctomycetia bacterium]